jgi:hypothetical protein
MDETAPNGLQLGLRATNNQRYGTEGVGIAIFESFCLVKYDNFHRGGLAAE